MVARTDCGSSQMYYIRIAAPAKRIANGSDLDIDIWVPMLQTDRSEHWHLVIWVPMLQMDRSEY